MVMQMSVRLRDLFSDVIYRIPEYQRPYAWIEKQLQDLWEDLETSDFLQPSNGQESLSNHYMGTVVVVRRNQRSKFGETFTVYDLIDGQQRLLTLVILLKAICDQLWKSGDDSDSHCAQNLYNRYVVRNDDQELRKLVLQGEDDAYLWDTVLMRNPLAMDPATPAQRRIRKAYRFFQEKIGNNVDNARALSESIANRLLFLRYDVQSELEAGLVFETINDRGKQLSEMDKIKSRLIYLGSKLGNNGFVNLVNQRWGKVMENIAFAHEDKDDTEREENQLIRYHWIMLTGRPRDYEVHRGVKDEYNLKSTTDLRKAEEYVNTLEEVSETYRQILKPLGPGFLNDWGKADPNTFNLIREYFEGLHRIETLANFMPLLFAARKRLSDPRYFLEVVRLCYLLGWRVYKVCNKRSDTGLHQLASFACSLYQDGTGVLQHVLDGMKSIILQHGSNESFESELQRNSLSQLEQKYLLYEWERRCASAGKTVVVSWDEINKKCGIEHIFPITPKYNWSSPQTKERYEKIKGLLGNLVLAENAFNSSMGNGFVHEKLGLRPPAPVDPKTGRELIYPKSGLVSQRRLADDQDLKVVAQLELNNATDTEILDAIEKFIQRRTDELVKFTLEHWSI